MCHKHLEIQQFIRGVQKVGGVQQFSNCSIQVSPDLRPLRVTTIRRYDDLILTVESCH